MALLTAKGSIVHTSGTYNSKGEFIAREVRSKLKFEKPKTRFVKDAELLEKQISEFKDLQNLLSRLK